MSYFRRLILAFALLTGIVPAFAQVPAAVPALPDTERRSSYSITASTCACTVNFALYGDSTDYQNWVEVFLNGTRVNYNDPSFGWAITVPTQTLATRARPISDAVLTFTSAQTGTVQIVGARRPRRAVQLSEGGVSARSLNQVFTDIIATQRETWDKTNDVTGRALLGPPGEAIATMPAAAARAGKYLGFDGTGLVPVLNSPPLAGTLVVNSSSVTGGTSGDCLFINSGILGSQNCAVSVGTRVRLLADQAYTVCASSCSYTNVQAAINQVANNLDLNGHNVNINSSLATDTQPWVISGPWVGYGTVSINGDVVTPANRLHQVDSNSAISLGPSANVVINGFKLVTTTSGDGFNMAVGSNLSFSAVDFGAAAGSHMQNSGGNVTPYGNYTISGDPGLAHIHMPAGGQFTPGVGVTITLSGARAWGAYFIGMRGPGYASFNNITFAGPAATNASGVIHIGAVLDMQSKPCNFLPGSTPVTAVHGGLVVCGTNSVAVGGSFTFSSATYSAAFAADSAGGTAFISYSSTGAAVILAQNGASFVTGADPGAGANKWWVRDNGIFTNRFIGVSGLNVAPLTTSYGTP